MNRVKLTLILIALSVSKYGFSQTDYSRYVDPFIGTGGHGHTYPGATVPFGMVQLSPDTRLSGWDGCSGYHYSDSVIYGFSHTHLSGTGCSDYGDILFMPMSDTWSFDNKIYSSPFLHKNEKASPGYYSVILDDGNILAELTATIRAGFHRYTFTESAYPYIILDLKHRDQVIASSLKITGKNRIEGMRRSKAWADDQYIFFVAEFSEPFIEYGIGENDSLKKGLKSSSSNNIKAWFRFGKGTRKVIMVKVGISLVGMEGARKNLEAEIKGWDFGQVCEQAEASWNRELSKIEVKGSPEQMKVFYTALYHTMVVPNVSMDVDGNYRGRDNRIHKATDFTYYSVFSLWDTYRAAHPLYTIIDRKRTEDYIKTFLAQYRQGGRLPVWELASNETDCMIGYHSVPVIADAVVKGITGFDLGLAFEAMKKSATWNHYGLPSYVEHGYIDVEDESESVSRTLEYAYDDWCISKIALMLKKDGDYDTFIQRAQFYKNLFDHTTGFMRPKKNGNWYSPFDPKEVNNNYTEANSWQYSFYVPQDISGLISRMGGPEAFVKKLDTLFTTGSETSGREQADITGLIGQYAHGNEPSHHMAYLYNFAGRPDKTQFYVHKILTEFYKPEPDGLIGNEDCGQMSAWYVLSAMGFYPVTPGTDIFVIGTPLFDEVKIHMENGKTFTIKTKRVNDHAFFIKEARLNGSIYNKSFIEYRRFLEGDSLEFELAEKPAEKFGHGTIHIPVTSISEHLITETPVISATGKSFYDSIGVTISACADCKIHYTVKGFHYSTEKPQEKVAAGKVSFYADSTVTVHAVAENAGRFSGQATASFFKAQKGRKIRLLSSYARQYSGGGDDALIDGIRGNENWRKGDWQGYWGKDFGAVLDLGSVRDVSSIIASFLQDTMAWIYLPSEAVFEISIDSLEWKELKPWLMKHYDVKINLNDQVKYKLNHNPDPGFGWYTVAENGPFKVRYIRITAKNHGKLPPTHPGAGGNSWIFIDEIMVD